MTYNEYKEIFKKDNNGCFVNLIIPKDFDGKELNLKGKKDNELDIDEIIKLKKYANYLFNKVVINNKII